MKINNLGSVNVNPRALEEFFKEDCIEVSLFPLQISVQVSHHFYQLVSTFLLVNLTQLFHAVYFSNIFILNCLLYKQIFCGHCSKRKYRRSD
jgi:hypothetical protein